MFMKQKLRSYISDLNTPERSKPSHHSTFNQYKELDMNRCPIIPNSTLIRHLKKKQLCNY